MYVMYRVNFLKYNLAKIENAISLVPVDAHAPDFNRSFNWIVLQVAKDSALPHNIFHYKMDLEFSPGYILKNPPCMLYDCRKIGGEKIFLHWPVLHDT